jgi:hypothetical protein
MSMDAAVGLRRMPAQGHAALIEPHDLDASIGWIGIQISRHAG